MRASIATVDRVDRARTCPLLVRVFVKTGRHHAEGDYSAERTPPDGDGFRVYTWRDATLREIAEQVKAQFADARDPLCHLEFSLVFPNASGVHILKRVGSLRASHGGAPSECDQYTLDTIKHQAGDYLDVAILRAAA